MSFLYPGFLWALFAVAVPVFIHLFNFRRYRKKTFPNVRLLKQIDHQTKTGNKLKKLLILACRILTIVFLVFAFAQPVSKDEKQKLRGGKKHISLILDNSYSMNLNGPEGPLLEAAKNRARSLINASGNDDEFNIITADMDASLLHFSGKETTLDALDKIKVSTQNFPLKNLLEQQNSSLMKYNGDKVAVCISDFQESTSSLQSNPLDSSISATWIRIPSENADNLSVDTCYLLSPVLQSNQPISLICQVSNFSANSLEGVILELRIDGNPKGVIALNIPAYGSSKGTIKFTLESGGNHQCELRLAGDNIPLDDLLYFGIRLNNIYRVACIGPETEKFISAVFSENPGFEFRKHNSGSVDFSDFRKRDLIILQSAGDLQSGIISELIKFIRAGGTVLAFPDKNFFFGGFSQLATAAGFQITEKALPESMMVSELDYNHPLFSHIFEKRPAKPDLPHVSQYYGINAPGGISVMNLANGKTFLYDQFLGKGHLLISSVALDPAFSNYQNHALFVPVALRSSMLSDYRNPLYYSCSEPGDIFTGLPFESEKGIRLQAEGISIVPEALNKEGDLYLNTNGEIRIPGQYRLFTGSDSISAILAFNTDRKESDTRTPDEKKFADLCSNMHVNPFEGSAEKLASQLHKMQIGNSLWKWCILFSLLSLLAEILLIRFFRNRNVSLSA